MRGDILFVLSHYFTGIDLKQRISTMKNTLRKIPLVLTIAIFICFSYYSLSEAKSEIYQNGRGLAIKGYDPVAYHMTEKPVEGSSQYELKWKDATWRFASEEHRDLFKANLIIMLPATAGIVPGLLLRDTRRVWILKTLGV